MIETIKHVLTSSFTLYLLLVLAPFSNAVETREQCHTCPATEQDKDRQAAGASEPVATECQKFALSPFRPNYILPLSYNSSPNFPPFRNYARKMDKAEVKFQVSLKGPVYKGVFNGYGDLYAAYTNISWWQAYNKELSSPFRETNHEPELFMVFPMQTAVLGMTFSLAMVGISHQSNGRSGDLSRSWNRLYANVLLERGDFVFSIKPWYRLKEDKKDPNEPGYPNVKGDDNPDIAKYMGHGELRFGYKIGTHQFGMMVRNNLRSSNNKGAVQLDWTLPLGDMFRGYIQYFNGYGESLVDYNASSNRISIGLALSEWR